MLCIMQSVRSYKMCIREPEFRCSVIHNADKVFHGSADMHGECNRGIVAGEQHQPVQ